MDLSENFTRGRSWSRDTPFTFHDDPDPDPDSGSGLETTGWISLKISPGVDLGQGNASFNFHDDPDPDPDSGSGSVRLSVDWISRKLLDGSL